MGRPGRVGVDEGNCVGRAKQNPTRNISLTDGSLSGGPGVAMVPCDQPGHGGTFGNVSACRDSGATCLGQAAAKPRTLFACFPREARCSGAPFGLGGTRIANARRYQKLLAVCLVGPSRPQAHLTLMGPTARLVGKTRASAHKLRSSGGKKMHR